MKRYIQILAFLNLLIWLDSCGSVTRVEPSGAVTVVGGVLSSIQDLTVQVKQVNGAVVTIAQTGFDGTSVANNGIAVVVPVAMAKYAFKTVQTNNVKDVKIGHQGVQNTALTHPITNTTSAIGPKGGTLNTSTTVVPAIPH